VHPSPERYVYGMQAAPIDVRAQASSIGQKWNWKGGIKPSNAEMGVRKIDVLESQLCGHVFLEGSQIEGMEYHHREVNSKSNNTPNNLELVHKGKNRAYAFGTAIKATNLKINSLIVCASQAECIRIFNLPQNDIYIFKNKFLVEKYKVLIQDELGEWSIDERNYKLILFKKFTFGYFILINLSDK